MKLLDAVNLVLPKLGERPVTSLEVKHPTLAVLLPIIEQTQMNTLQRGWWFNEYEYTAYPNAQGEIGIGVDAPVLAVEVLVDRALDVHRAGRIGAQQLDSRRRRER